VTQRRGWIWLFAGILMALIAGLLTFRTINEVSSNAESERSDGAPTLQVLVAAQNISARQLIDQSMVQIQKVPVLLAHEGYMQSTEEVLFKMSSVPIVAGEIMLRQRLTDPTDPESPVLYQISDNEVLISVPASAMLGQIGMLAVGDHIDIAYTVSYDFNVTDEEETTNAQPATTFLSLQNLEVKGLLRKQATTNETTALLGPDALLLAVSPQDALVLKHLIDIGAPMDFFLRAPGNEALSPVIPVDSQYLVDRFQLQIDTGQGLAATQAFSRTNPLDIAAEITSAVEQINAATQAPLNNTDGQ
jgi:Flp pilus assembly protein CpaB